jgi:signal transduction histidine kinase
MRSLRFRLWILGAFAILASVGVSVLLVQFYEQSSTSQTSQGESEVSNTCEAIQVRFAFYTKGWDGGDADLSSPALRGDLRAVVADALFTTPEVDGGIWQERAGLLSYVGAVPFALLPQADRAAVARINREVMDSGLPALTNDETPTGRTLIAACPLKLPLAGISAWTRIETKTGLGFVRLRLGLALLLLLALGMSAWLTWLVILWSRHIGRIETTLSRYHGDDMPVLAMTGEKELDRIVDALNDVGRRLAEGRHRSEELARRVASAERLAALGRVAAGVAHEIRNPLASMQLKAENALEGDDERRRVALSGMLGQISRLNGLVTELLEFTQPRKPHPVTVDTAEFFAARIEDHREAAATAEVTIAAQTDVDKALFDPALVTRILDNLIGNAIRHSGAGASISIHANRAGNWLQICVADSGTGIEPGVRNNLFEPFVTSRADGSGLGLAISREIAEMHGGRLSLVRAGGEGPRDGARFLLELPWQPS